MSHQTLRNPKRNISSSTPLSTLETLQLEHSVIEANRQLIKMGLATPDSFEPRFDPEAPSRLELLQQYPAENPETMRGLFDNLPAEDPRHLM